MMQEWNHETAQEIAHRLELMRSSGERVIERLQGTTTQECERPLTVREEVELLERREALVDLALAQYGAEISTLRTLWDRDEALRPVILANKPVHRRQNGTTIPQLVSGCKTNQEFVLWIKRAPKVWRWALFSNPALKLDVAEWLEPLLLRESPFDALDETTIAEIASSLANHPLVANPVDHRSIHDGWDLYFSSRPRHAMATLLARVDPSHAWGNLIDSTFGRKDEGWPGEVDAMVAAIRWESVVLAEKTNENGMRKGRLPSPMVLGTIALFRVAGRRDASLLGEFKESPSFVRRAAYYSLASLTRDGMISATKKDGGIFLLGGARNWLTGIAMCRLYKQGALAYEKLDHEAVEIALEPLERMARAAEERHEAEREGEEEADRRASAERIAEEWRLQQQALLRRVDANAASAAKAAFFAAFCAGLALLLMLVR